jgi:hypothetical protein
MQMGVPDSMERAIRRSRFLRTLFVTRDGSVVTGQTPNAPIYVWLAFGALGFFARGTVHHWCEMASESALAVWSVLEIGWGVNLFRRILGVVVGALFVSWLLKG